MENPAKEAAAPPQAESELTLLRAKLAKMENDAAEEAALRAQAEKRTNAMSRLQKILDDTRDKLKRNSYSSMDRRGWLGELLDGERADLVDTLIDIIHGLNERIARLERQIV